MDSMSAHQRPSPSCPKRMGIDSGEIVSIDLAAPPDIIASLIRADPPRGPVGVAGYPLSCSSRAGFSRNGNIPAKVEWPGGVRRLKAVFSFRSRLSLPGG